MRRTWTLIVLLGLTALVAMASAQGAAAQSGASLPRHERAMILQGSRAQMVSRDQRLRDLCGSGCATPGVQDAADALLRLDRDTLPVLDAAIARLDSGREATDGQKAAMLDFRDQEHELVGRLRAALQQPGDAGEGDTAVRLGHAAGQLLASLTLLGIPVVGFVVIRRLVRRRSAT